VRPRLQEAHRPSATSSVPASYALDRLLVRLLVLVLDLVDRQASCLASRPLTAPFLRQRVTSWQRAAAVGPCQVVAGSQQVFLRLVVQQMGLVFPVPRVLHSVVVQVVALGLISTW